MARLKGRKCGDDIGIGRATAGELRAVGVDFDILGVVHQLRCYYSRIALLCKVGFNERNSGEEDVSGTRRPVPLQYVIRPSRSAQISRLIAGRCHLR
jgi:hypothetical protein